MEAIPKLTKDARNEILLFNEEASEEHSRSAT
jgi:hypothetical protein